MCSSEASGSPQEAAVNSVWCCAMCCGSWLMRVGRRACGTDMAALAPRVAGGGAPRPAVWRVRGRGRVVFMRDWAIEPGAEAGTQNCDVSPALCSLFIDTARRAAYESAKL